MWDSLHTHTHHTINQIGASHPSLYSLILSQHILTDVLRNETTQNTEVEKI